MPPLPRIASLFTTLLICAFANSLSAQPGNLDSAFEVKFTSPSSVSAILPQNDDRIMIGGHFSGIDDVSRNGIARLHLNGSLDTSFDPGQGVGGSGSPAVHTIAVQSDGKYIIGGDFLTVDGTPQRLLARLNPNGSLDSAFRPTLSGNSVNSIVVQPDGRILVAGAFDLNSGGVNYRSVMRLNSDGSVDSTFHIPLFPRGAPPSFGNIVLLEDSRMIIASGGAYIEDGNNVFLLIKTLTNSSLDPTFQHLKHSSDHQILFSYAVRPDDKILLSSRYSLSNGTPKHTLTRLNSDGTQDLTFDSFQGPNNVVRSILPQPDGKILVGGDFTQFYRTPRNRIVRLSANGEVDTTFNPGSGFDNRVTVLALQNDNKVLVGGSFSTFDGQVRFGIARLLGGDPPPAAPTITAQPRVQSIPVGHNAHFEVSATGFPLSYQWQKDGIDLPGETRPLLHVWNAKTNDMGSYQVVVSNSSGTAISTPVHLNVMPPISDSSSLVSNPSFEYLDSSFYIPQWTAPTTPSFLLRYPENAPVTPFGFQFPAQGTNYIRLYFSYNVSPGFIDPRGPSSTRLLAPLSIGKKYEVSGWLSVPENQPSPQSISSSF